MRAVGPHHMTLALMCQGKAEAGVEVFVPLSLSLKAIMVCTHSSYHRVVRRMCCY